MMPTICARCAKLEERIKELERENGKLAAFKEGAMAAAALARPPHVTINNPAPPALYPPIYTPATDPGSTAYPLSKPTIFCYNDRDLRRPIPLSEDF